MRNCGLPWESRPDDLAIKHTLATSEVMRQPLAEAGEGFEDIAVPGYQPHAIVIGKQQSPETVPLDLKQPIWMAERPSEIAEGHGLEQMERHSSSVFA